MKRYYTYDLNSYRRSPIMRFLKMIYDLVYSTTSLADFLVRIKYFDLFTVSVTVNDSPFDSETAYRYEFLH